MIYVMKLDERFEYELPDGSRITLAEIMALREALPEDAEPVGTRTVTVGKRAELVRRIGEWHDRNTAKNIGANMQNKRREEAHWLLNVIRDYLERK